MSDPALHAAVQNVVSQLPEVTGRELKVTLASKIELKAIEWTWADRIPDRALTLLAGREGVGKSLIMIDACAQLTRGELNGLHYGSPKNVIYLANEDSWSQTIAPRFLAAGADMNRVLKVELVSRGIDGGGVMLPIDDRRLGEMARDYDVALIALDPIASHIDPSIDAYKDRAVRTALEPLARLADDVGLAVVGLVHHGKGGSVDPLNLILGSRAYTAVARSVLVAARDTISEDGSCVLSLEKSNLGSLDIESMSYTIESEEIEIADGKVAKIGKLKYHGTTKRTAREILEHAPTSSVMREERNDAQTWLRDYLEQKGGEAKCADVKKAAAKDDFNDSALNRARIALGVQTIRKGFGEGSMWHLPGFSKDSLHSDHSSHPQSDESNEMDGIDPTARMTLAQMRERAGKK